MSLSRYSSHKSYVECAMGRLFGIYVGEKVWSEGEARSEGCEAKTCVYVLI